MKKYLLATLILQYAISVAALTMPLPNNYKDNLSVLVVDTQTKLPIYALNPDQPRLIASNMKLFTTFAALNILHPDFHWVTNVYYTGHINNGILYGNLYIRGGGDPTLTSSDMYRLFSNLKRLGVREISGNILFDDHIFNSTTSYSMLKIEPFDSDTITPHALMIDNNLVQLDLKLDNKNVFLTSNLYGYNLINKLKLDKKESSCKNIYEKANLDFAAPNLTLTGNIPLVCLPMVLNYNLLPNFTYNKMVVQKVLSDFTIRLRGVYLNTQEIPKHATLIATHSSPSLAETIIPMNHFSNNLTAETIFLSLGAFASKNHDTELNSRQILENFLVYNGLYSPISEIENGAGLSRHEQFSAHNLVTLLMLANNSTVQPSFEASLPIAGEEGTLANNFLTFGTRLHMKTGTLNDTRAYSGYFYALDGHKYAFSILAHIDTTQDAENQALNMWVEHLFTQLNQIHTN
jgi:D-alanyl-D-alanine carboxypeptidase/D-alanyl-D-alanine-endopeptidase (penicillin-binding protein 4)